MPAKTRPAFSCTECGWTTSKWVGRCGECQAWGTVTEAAASTRVTQSLTPVTPAQPITAVTATASERWSTHVPEFDRVLGGGLVPGAVVLVAGEPGIGKSTLLLDVAAQAAQGQGDRPVLYVSAEESASQVRLRAERIGAMHENLHLAAEADLGTILGHVRDVDPQLLVVDSVQTVADAGVEGMPGGTSQVRAVAAALVSTAKSRGLPILVVGHVTKDGSIAGPRVLEHLVDVVCQFEGDRHSRLRMVRAVKNRYGPTDEVGCFELVDAGIFGLADPSGIFLSDRQVSVPGTCATITLEGRRPLPVEVQSLVVGASGPPRRTTSNVDSSRIAMTVAVLQSRCGLALDRTDVFVSTVGGARAMEPSADLAAALSLTSSYAGLPLAPGVAAMGEVTLTGEIRPVVGLDQRVKEAGRLGFTTVLVPERGEAPTAPRGIKVIRVGDVTTAIGAVLPKDVLG